MKTAYVGPLKVTHNLLTKLTHIQHGTSHISIKFTELDELIKFLNGVKNEQHN